MQKMEKVEVEVKKAPQKPALADAKKFSDKRRRSPFGRNPFKPRLKDKSGSENVRAANKSFGVRQKFAKKPEKK